jgi:UDP-N-acetylmuramoylalanine--D-glutamate ligase
MKKQVSILGAGESGTAAALLAKWLGFAVFVSDKNAIKPAFKSALEQAGIPYEEGGHTMDTILNATQVIKSPGIPETTAVMLAIRARAIPVLGEIEFAWQHRPQNSKTIAITGSNGKTTTTGLIHHLLETAGMPAVLGGNIGTAFSRLVLQDLQNPVQDRIYVIEISSFQLEDIVQFRPEIALLLNITPDHLDRYANSIERYADAKFQITKNQGQDDIFIFNADDPVVQNYIRTHDLSVTKKIAVIAENYKNGRLRINNKHEFDTTASKLRGPHNFFNALCAVETALALGAEPAKIQQGLNSFKPPAHRMEVVAKVNGVRYINDSKATNVDAVFYALQAMEQPTIWIVGGQDKGNDYKPLLQLVQEKVKTIVCMGLDNRPILTAFKQTHKNIIETRSALEAVKTAADVAAPGDTVLLSPACASFDLFKNYEDRGEQFRAAVLSLNPIRQR